jgi:phospholipase/lecithinase/hemolysin
MKKKLLGALTLVAAMGLPASANASLQTLSDLFVFGDSLSDGGNSGIVSRAATGGTVTYPPFPYYNGQYSNGPVAVEYLWQSYNGGAPFAPSLAGGTNYAIGGATTGLENFNSVSPSTGPLAPAYDQLSNNWQLNTFGSQLAGARTFDPATSLFVVWLFPNDVFYSATGSTPGSVDCLTNPLASCAGVPLASGLPGVSQLIGNGVSNILATVAYLASLGAQHFLVPNMPDLGKTPEFSGTVGEAGLTALTQGFNATLAYNLSLLDASLTSAEIVQFDTYGAFDRIRQDPGAYGIKNTTQQCIQNYTACAADNFQWTFWDGVHPTTYAHSILGAEFRAAVPEPESILLLAIGLFGIFVTRRRAA